MHWFHAVLIFCYKLHSDQNKSNFIEMSAADHTSSLTASSLTHLEVAGTNESDGQCAQSYDTFSPSAVKCLPLNIISTVDNCIVHKTTITTH